MIDASGIFRMKTPNTETTGELLSQLSSILAVGTRDDGKLYLSDMCQAESINCYARNKPEDFDKQVNLDKDDRKANHFGFKDMTPEIVPLDREIPHAPYTYHKPQGGLHSMNRLRDFNGYNHKAKCPFTFSLRTEKVQRDQINDVTVMINSSSNGWDGTTDVYLHEVMDDDSQDCNVALLVNNGRHSYVLPSDLAISDTHEQTSWVLTFLFAKDEELFGGQSYPENVFHFVIEDMKDDDKDTEYTIAVVACPTKYQGMYPVNQETLKSMEIKYGVDRKTYDVTTADSLAGLSVNLNALGGQISFNLNAAERVDYWYAYTLEESVLRVPLVASSSWGRTSVYIVLRITNNYGYITDSSSSVPSSNTGSIDIAKDIAIKAEDRVLFDASQELGDYKLWCANGNKSIKLQVLAFPNKDDYDNEINGRTLFNTTYNNI